LDARIRGLERLRPVRREPARKAAKNPASPSAATGEQSGAQPASAAPGGPGHPADSSKAEQGVVTNDQPPSPAAPRLPIELAEKSRQIPAAAKPLKPDPEAVVALF